MNIDAFAAWAGWHLASNGRGSQIEDTARDLDVVFVHACCSIVITSPWVEVAKGVFEVGYGVETCLGDHCPIRCPLCHQDGGGCAKNEGREH